MIKAFLIKSSPVLFGAMGGQIISILTLPLLMSLYSPESFGFYSLILSLVSIISITSTLRIDRCFLSCEPKDKQRLYQIQIKVLVSMATLLAVLLIAANTLFTLFDNPIAIIPIYAISLVTGILNVSTTLLISDSDYYSVGKISFIRPVVVFIGQLSLFYILEQKTALMTATFIAITGCAIFSAKKSSVKTILCKKDDNKESIKKYIDRQYLLNGLFQNTLTTLSNNANILIVAAIFSPTILGIYSASEKLVRLPINVVSNRLKPLLAHRFSNTTTSKRILIQYSLASGGIACLGWIAFFLFGDAIGQALLPEKWLACINMIKYLLGWVVFNFFCLPFQAYNTYLSPMSSLSKIELLLFTIKIALILTVLAFHKSIYGIIYSVVAISILHLLFHIIVSFNAIKKGIAND